MAFVTRDMNEMNRNEYFSKLRWIGPKQVGIIHLSGQEHNSKVSAFWNAQNSSFNQIWTPSLYLNLKLAQFDSRILRYLSAA